MYCKFKCVVFFIKKLSSVCFFPDLFASSVKSLIPRPPIQCSVGVVVCVVEELEKNNIVLRERVGGNVHDLGQDSARTTAHYDNSQELLYTSKDAVFLPSDATSG